MHQGPIDFVLQEHVQHNLPAPTGDPLAGRELHMCLPTHRPHKLVPGAAPQPPACVHSQTHRAASVGGRVCKACVRGI